ncbi:hypothetical protein [Rhodopseudomonas palustris]|uniref:hypothetical protein n=1 Tax=Rhodopseudomonas palustris TaxID=1076 RepID=UPI0011C4472E|nr:hypothetical protein [Rhodopseudomonas palustris]
MTDDLDPRTRANMEVALERVCGTLPNGQEHAVRARVAAQIAECARAGGRTLHEFEAAGQAAAIRNRLRHEAQRSH